MVVETSILRIWLQWLEGRLWYRGELMSLQPVSCLPQEALVQTMFNSKSAEDARLTTEHIVIISDLLDPRGYTASSRF